MYIVEKSDGSEAARWNNLTNPNWPDGSSTSGRLKPADMVRDGEDGETYTVKEVLQKTEGEGPRNLGVASVKKVGDEWHQVTTMGPALPPPPDPKPGDDNYNYATLRRRDYPILGDQFDMQFHDLIDGTETWKDAIQAVKAKWPKEIDSGISLEQPTVPVDADTNEDT
jgi:hypothetical protein